MDAPTCCLKWYSPGRLHQRPMPELGLILLSTLVRMAGQGEPVSNISPDVLQKHLMVPNAKECGMCTVLKVFCTNVKSVYCSILVAPLGGSPVLPFHRVLFQPWRIRFIGNRAKNSGIFPQRLFLCVCGDCYIFQNLNANVSGIEVRQMITVGTRGWQD